LSFIFGNLSVLIARWSKAGVDKNLDARIIISNALVLIWGLRMSVHVFLRTELGKEDRRFEKLRAKLMEAGGPALYYCVAFCGIFMFNGCVITAINGSALYISMRSGVPSGDSLKVTDYLGIVVWLVGFSILVVADHQLRIFKQQRALQGVDGPRLCKTGLWAYSRHPNFFGEAVVWWGIYLMAVSVEGGWITIWSPILIGLLLRFVSGVPTVEDLYQGDPEFEKWKESTNTFILLPKKEKK